MKMGKIKDLMIEFEDLLAKEQKLREEYERKRFKRDDFYDKSREYWRSISGYDDYEVSTHGRIRNINTMKISMGSLLKSGYRIVLIGGRKGRVCYIHRLVAENWIRNDDCKRCVDHIDNNKDNNHISNLRWATTKENSCNRLIDNDNKSGFKGVSYRKDIKKYSAQIKHNWKQYHLGYFESPEEAHKAYCDKAKELFGEFARFN